MIVSSKNSALRFPDEGDAVINLDLVGQDFADINDLFSGLQVQAFTDMFTFDPDTAECMGGCDDPQPDGVLDALTRFAGSMGFAEPLAVDILLGQSAQR